jgi:hypothetical protein
MTVSIFPAGDALPSVVGQSNKFLGTDGTSLNWSSPIPNTNLFTGYTPSSLGTVTLSNFNAKNSIFLMLGNWSAAPGIVEIRFNTIAKAYNTEYAAWNGSSSGTTEPDSQTLRTSIQTGNIQGSPAMFLKIEGAGSTGPKTLIGWSQAEGANNLWGGTWDDRSPITSISISTNNSVAYSYRMVTQ